MALISVDQISIAFGMQPLLDKVTFSIEKNERIAIIGRNGTGKTTLLKILAGLINADSGNIVRQQGIHVGFFKQNVITEGDKTVYETVSEGLEEKNRHEMLHLVDRIISLMSLPGDRIFQDLSAGVKRRVLFAQAVVSTPDLLLLDEPTNHLDVESIIWMEDFINRYQGTVVMITHDRMFLNRCSKRIIELESGRILDWICPYSQFLERREAFYENEQKAWEKQDKLLAQEEVWIRRGIKARRTRNEGRVAALFRLRQEVAKRRQQIGTVSISVGESSLSGKLVVEARDIGCSFGERTLFSRFSIRLMRGERLGIIGRNGCGKSSLIKILLGELEPSQGSVRLGENVVPLYFDQLRTALDENMTVRDTIAQGDFVIINNERKHIFSYLEDFLFSPKRALSKVSSLSGGERNRLLLAKLFTQPSNLLILDEPTNDLDVDTLDVLEDVILNYSGTVIIVSHDRSFLDNTITSLISFYDAPVLTQYPGNFTDFYHQYSLKKEEISQIRKQEKKDSKTSDDSTVSVKTKKRSFKENRELEALPEQIESLEQKIAHLYAALSDPLVCKDKNSVCKAKEELAECEKALQTAFDRWHHLENLG